MNFEQFEKEFNDLMKHGQELIEKLKQKKEVVKEATEEDVGKLCWFWDDNENKKVISILASISVSGFSFGSCLCYFTHCRRLTPAEVAKITGYKVEE